MMIYLLTGILILLTAFTYSISKGDYMSPPFLMCAFFTLSELCVISMSSTWNIHISLDTFMLILLGLLFFVIGYYSESAIHKRRSPTKSRLQYIYFSKILIVLYCIALIILDILFIHYVRESVGGAGWTDTLARYRFTTAYGNQTGESTSIPSWIVDARFVLVALAYLFCYILVNNFLVTKKMDKGLVVAILIGLVSTLIGSSRFDLIRIPLCLVTMYYLLKFRCGLLTYKEKTKLLIRYIIIAFIAAILFSVLKSFVGRQSNRGIFEYIAGYLGTPTLNFNEYLENPIKKNSLFGKETFWGVYNFLYKLTGRAEYNYDYTLEFRTIGGHSMGNVYTAFRMFYSDFGILGLCVLSALQGAVYSFLYYTAKYNIKFRFTRTRILPKSIIDFRIIVYGMILHSIILMFYADWFYSQVISWYQIKSFIWIYVLKILLVDLNVKTNIKRCVTLWTTQKL